MREIEPESIIATDQADGAGAATWWRLTGTAEMGRLAGAWQAAGLDPSLLPAGCSPEAALTRAVREACAAHRLVARPFKKAGGWALRREREDEAADDIEASTILVVRIDLVGRVKADVREDGAEAIAVAVAAAYDRHLAELSTGDVSAWLADLVARLDAIPLREGGGIYFIAPARLDEWRAWAHAAMAASAHRIHLLPAMRCDEAVAAILAAAEAEAEAVAAALEDDLTNDDLGHRALETRAGRAEAAAAKLASYEALLGGRLDGMREKLVRLRADLVARALSTEAGA